MEEVRSSEMVGCDCTVAGQQIRKSQCVALDGRVRQRNNCEVPKCDAHQKREKN